MPQFSLEFARKEHLSIRVDWAEHPVSPIPSPRVLSPPYDLMTPPNRPGPLPPPPSSLHPPLSSFLSQPRRSTCRPMKEEKKDDPAPSPPPPSSAACSLSSSSSLPLSPPISHLRHMVQHEKVYENDDLAIHLLSGPFGYRVLTTTKSTEFPEVLKCSEIKRKRKAHPTRAPIRHHPAFDYASTESDD